MVGLFRFLNFPIHTFKVPPVLFMSPRRICDLPYFNNAATAGCDKNETNLKKVVEKFL